MQNTSLFADISGKMNSTIDLLSSVYSGGCKQKYVTQVEKYSVGFIKCCFSCMVGQGLW